MAAGAGWPGDLRRGTVCSCDRGAGVLASQMGYGARGQAGQEAPTWELCVSLILQQ